MYAEILTILLSLAAPALGLGHDVKDHPYRTYSTGKHIYGNHNYGNHHVGNHHHLTHHQYGSYHHYSILEYFFPCNGLWNAVLATVYVALVPSLLAYFVPGLRAKVSNKHSIILPLLASLAFGALMGDIFLHMFPEIFRTHELDAAEHMIELIKRPDERVAAALIAMAEKHNTTAIMGTSIFAGYLLFMAIDKALRIASGDNYELTRYHGQGRVDALKAAGSSVHSIMESLGNKVEKRKRQGSRKERNANESDESYEHEEVHEKQVSQPSGSSSQSSDVQHLDSSTYVSLATGLVQNFTIGLALASSFYTSKRLGIATTIAVLLHEIPNGLYDFTTVLSNGVSNGFIIKNQFTAVVGAIIGTLLGCTINEAGREKSKFTFIPEIGLVPTNRAAYANRFHVAFRDIVLPVTAGGLLCVCTLNVGERLINIGSSKNKPKEIKKSLFQLAAIIAGFSLMAVVT
ncbi:HDL109Cp [Eremothecium sinecaudum]|uniref:HDL109Cp n=1 Tax=Eremothecium sinecaudum TaxID=45286 RepID=A0A0X8HSG0_9SACH|nr:HDL109Cp [Eremothecium sinecaudum]AMD20635.1 HDL109Cp [Eremothecium sinecaudum]